MNGELKYFAKIAGLLLATAFIIFLVNQIAGVVGLASELHAYFGIFVLVPPTNKFPPAYQHYLNDRRKRLQTNPFVIEGCRRGCHRQGRRSSQRRRIDREETLSKVSKPFRG